MTAASVYRHGGLRPYCSDLQEWQVIFVVLCTFAKGDAFANLPEHWQLGQRLEFQTCLAKNVESNGFEELRKEATIAYFVRGLNREGGQYLVRRDGGGEPPSHQEGWQEQLGTSIQRMLMRCRRS